MRVMQVSIDQIIDVVTVRYRFVPAPWTVNMLWPVTRAHMPIRACIRIVGRDFHFMLIHVPLVHMVQMPIVQVVDMVAVLDRGVSAARPMLMAMIGVVRFFAVCHVNAPQLHDHVT